MQSQKNYITQLFAARKIKISPKNETAYLEFIAQPENKAKVTLIQELQHQMAKDWEFINRKLDIQQQQIMLPNGIVGRDYFASFDLKLLELSDLQDIEILDLDAIGLTYDVDKKVILGIPVCSGNLAFRLFYSLKKNVGEIERDEKIIPIIINPDPKSLWKNLASDTSDLYWKADDCSAIYELGEKIAVIASKRGRSHANKGSFRDDDFIARHFFGGWNLIAVSDGAGSAVLGRKGAEIACTAIADYFEAYFRGTTATVFDAEALKYHGQDRSYIAKEYTEQVLGGAKFVYNRLQEFANSIQQPIADLHATLAFTLFKKFSFGYVILSFGVGDSPIAVIDATLSSVQVLNTIDTGEYGGGTRFITMAEIFEHQDFQSRFRSTIMEDFSYMFLMTDGIYDPKFEVEANLEKVERWHDFIADLKGDNPERTMVQFNVKNEETVASLERWMDFWSTGNHDDRTLAILY